MKTANQGVSSWCSVRYNT